MPSKAVLPWVWICFSVLCCKIRNLLLVFVFWQHSSHLSAALTVSSNLPLSLYQPCTILYIIEWCLRFLFLLQHKVINKGMISPSLQASLHPSSFCLGLASSPSGIVLLKLIRVFSQKIWVLLWKAIRSVNVSLTPLSGHLFMLFVLFDWFIGLFSLYTVEESDCGQR